MIIKKICVFSYFIKMTMKEIFMQQQNIKNFAIQADPFV